VTTKIYDIGPFRLDTEAGVLTKAGKATAAGSRAIAVLATLVARPNQYIPKASLMDAAWQGVVVEESNLAVQISSLRRVLSQAPGGEHWIETLARRGYRYVGPVAAPTDLRDSASASRPRSNLPEPLTSFIGRERELVQMKRLLPSKRLLTIVGVGGIGKTRLALQAAAEVVDAYCDGVWVIELGSISQPLLVPTSVAQVLGVKERTGTPLVDTLSAHLKERQLLLILDNCEHLLEACSRLADGVLRAAANTTIIATSREPLHVEGEQTYPLQALSLPEASGSADAVARSEAVQLFVERARRQLPDFALTGARASAVAELCIHLDGIPLALELAAARMRSLSIEQINARLHDRLRLLTSGIRSAVPRQQTLRAALDWSYDLLAEDERKVLRRLGVFAGSFTLEAASSVTSDQTIDEFAVIDLVGQLVERSLIVADTGDSRARYRLLETMRAYALEKLAEACETNALRRRHGTYFRDLFERAPDDSLRMTEADWRAVYLPELDNVRAVLDWALGPEGDNAIAVALAGASGSMWVTLSLYDEGVQRLEAAAARVGPDTSESDEARLCMALGIRLGEAAPPRAVVPLERAIDLYRRLEDAPWLAQSLLKLGVVLAMMGQFERAPMVFAEALPWVQRVGLPKLFAVYFKDLGGLNVMTGDSAGARACFERAVTLYREAGAESAALAVLVMLADVTWALGDLDAARDALIETVARLRNSPLSSKDSLGVCLLNLSGVHTERGELDCALTAAREGLPLLQEAGYAWSVCDILGLRAALAGNLASAARVAGYADSAFAAMKASRQHNEARAHERLHALLREQCDSAELERLLVEGAHMNESEACRLALED